MDKIICYCRNVFKTEIEQAISGGAKTLKDIQEITGACTGHQCKEMNPTRKCCSSEINKILNDNRPTQTGHCSCCS